MTINSKPTLAVGSASEKVRTHQSLNPKKAQGARADDAKEVTSGQETEAPLAGRPSNDVLDLSVSTESLANSEVPARDPITSVTQAETAAAALSESILKEPDEAMQAQAGLLSQSVMELIR